MSIAESGVSTPKQKKDLYLATSLCDGLEDHDYRQLTTLLDNKQADPNVFMPLHGVTPFHLVIGNDSLEFAEEATKLFLRHGGNPNVRSEDGMTPVHVAAAWGRVKILALLLANGGDPYSLDNDKCSPFDYAFQGGHYNTVNLLTKYCVSSNTEDEEPKYKLELEKVLVNNGDVLAEYIASNYESCNNNENCSSISLSTNTSQTLLSNLSDCVTNASFDTEESLRTDYVTSKFENYEDTKVRLRKPRVCAKSNVTCEERKENLINHSKNYFSSQFKDSLYNLKYQDPPRRKEIKMIFNRPSNGRKSNTLEIIKENNALSNLKNKTENGMKSNTLQIIKGHSALSHLKNNTDLNFVEKFVYVGDKNILNESTDAIPTICENTNNISKKLSLPISKNVNNYEASFEVSKWVDETIISKSPNLIFFRNTEKNKVKLRKKAACEKKLKAASVKLLSKQSPTFLASRKNMSKFSNKAHESKILKPKKYFVTPEKSDEVNLENIEEFNIEIPQPMTPKKRPADFCLNVNNGTKQSYKINKTDKLSLSFELNEIGEQVDTNYLQSIENFVDFSLCEEEVADYKNSSAVEDKTKKKFSSSENEKRLTVISPGKSECMSGVAALVSKYESFFNRKENHDTYLKNSSGSSHSLSGLSNKDGNDAIINNNETVLTAENSLEYFDSINGLQGSALSDSTKESFLSTAKAVDDTECIKNASSLLEQDSQNTLNKSLSKHNSFLTFKNEPLLHHEQLGTSGETFISIDEEYKYHDPEEGVQLLERRLCVTPSCLSSDMNTSFYSCSTAKSEPLPMEILRLDNLTLRERLVKLGENPGPITNTTHHLYLKRLHKLLQKKQLGESIFYKQDDENHSLVKSSLLSMEWMKKLDDYEGTEQKVFLEFSKPDTSRKWREGCSKNSFNYLLLDPRITKDLPRRAANLSLSEKWKTFLSAIFYVGKGKRARPYAHLYDAFKIWVSKDNYSSENNKKIQTILDIWNDGKGVVVLHVFQNTIPVEAYTREAVIIKALGTEKLSNCKLGECYGVVATWNSKEKIELGRYLLYKALQIFLLEGERQIFPDNL